MWTFTVGQSGGLSQSLIDMVLDVLEDAADYWGRYIDFGIATLDIEISFISLGEDVLAQAGPTFIFDRVGPGGENVFQAGTILELQSGTDPNGADPDIFIEVNLDTLLAGEFHIGGLDNANIGFDEFDLFTVLMHEIGHGLGIISFEEGPGGDVSEYELLVTSSGQFFTGTNAVAVFGGNVPLDDDESHIGISADLLHSRLPPDTRILISAIDTAILQDIGLSLLAPTSGDDVLYGYDLVAGTGHDVVSLLGGGDLYFGLSGNDTIDGGSGNDTIDGGSEDDNILGGLGWDLLTGGSGADYIDGGGGNDDITDENGRNTLYGGSGDDTISAGSSDDYIDGGADDDSILGGLGRDTVLGGIGADSIFGDRGNDHLSGEDGDDLLSGGGEIDTILGGVGNDIIFGGDFGDHLFGEEGNDDISGDEGDDTIEGGDGADTLSGGLGRDSISGGGQNDVIFGGDEDDELSGGDNDDVLSGGAGSDLLSGDAGDDTLTGGDGVDFFIIASGAGSDTITDLSTDVSDFDVIDLSGFEGVFSSPAEVLAAAAQDSDDVVIDLGGGQTLSLENTLLSDINESQLRLLIDFDALVTSDGETHSFLGVDTNGFETSFSGLDITFNEFTAIDLSRIDIEDSGSYTSVIVTSGSTYTNHGLIEASAKAEDADNFSLRGLAMASNGIAINYGTVFVSGPAGLSGIGGAVSGGEIQNHGTIDIQQTSISNGDAIGINAFNTRIINNTGQIHVSGTSEAIGISGGAHGDITNTGAIEVSTTSDNRTALGISSGDELFNSGVIDAVNLSNIAVGVSGFDELINTNLIIATGVTARGVTVVRDYIENSGDIIAVATGDFEESIGISLSSSDQVTILNSGVVNADISINASGASTSGNKTIINSGELHGHILLAPGADQIDNSNGVINGDIEFGAGDDVLDNTLGLINGVVFGGVGADTLNGGDAADHFLGEISDDRLFGGGGNDTLDGGDGDDRAEGGAGNDVISGGLGKDTLRGALGDDTLDGGDSNDTIFGGGGADMADGGAGNDRIRPDAGNDTVNGGLGVDRIFGSYGFDSLMGDAGDDFLDGNGGNDKLEGGDHNDTLIGNFGWDELDGEAGDDRLQGSTGNDTVTGGLGDDTFVFALGDDNDRYVDFTAGAGTDDVIELSGFGTSFDEFSEVFAAASQQGSNVVIDFGAGDAITLLNTTLANLHEDDFVFA